MTYAIYTIADLRCLYVGPSESKAADAPEPGTAWGSGDTDLAAKADAKTKIKRLWPNHTQGE